jgi:uncharacterized pyridoxal phosphate-containing UPF0001 family protein
VWLAHIPSHDQIFVAQQGGVEPEACVALVRAIREGCPHLAFEGFMTIGMYVVAAPPPEHSSIKAQPRS